VTAPFRHGRIGAALGAALLVCAISAPALGQVAPAGGPAEMISSFRLKNGQGRVTLDPTLTKIAHDQAAAMAEKSVLDHDVLGSFSKRMAPANAGTAAENIAYGYDSFPKTLDQWIGSPSHRKNLLLKDASRIGVASVRSADKRTYWAMVIAGGYEAAKPAKPTKPAKDAKPAPTKPATAGKAADATKRPKPAAKQSCTIKILGLCI
jgi:cell division septation protein DedD